LPLRLATYAMGTRFELVLDGADEPRLRAAGEEALFEIEDADRRLSLFRRDSLLSHLARSAAARPGEWVRLDADTYALLELCVAVHRASDGAFDPTVAPLMRALGLHDERSQAPRLDLESSRATVGGDALELDPRGRRARLFRPGAHLDLGAIGKGHALDLAARALREQGIERALLHGGTSSVAALGAPPGAAAWRVRLGAGPDAPVAALRDSSLSLSSPSGRTVAGERGELVGHVLDPKSGRPARRFAAVAVVTPCAAQADAWSTAALVGGPRLVPAGIECWTAVDSGGTLRWTPHALGRSCIALPQPQPTR